MVKMIMMQKKLAKIKTEIVIPLKPLSKFWRTLSKQLIDCQTELILTCLKNCVLTDMIVRDAGNNDRPAIVAATGLEFQIEDTKLYVPVVTLSTENGKKEL